MKKISILDLYKPQIEDLIKQVQVFGVFGKLLTQKCLITFK